MVLAGDWFKEWFNSHYYYDLYDNRDEKEAASLVNQLLSALSLAPSSYLFDVGCGRGRHARIMAESGFDVTGIDIAPDSIEYAKKFETDHLHFYLHDMRLPCWINYFDAAFSFFTSFGYFKTRREHDNALRSITQALKPGGFFLLDYINPAFAEANLVLDSEKKTDHATYYLTKWSDDHHFYKKIRVEDKRKATSTTFTERVEKFSFETLSDMFDKQGLQVVKVYGDYALSSFDNETSPRMMLLAKKRTNVLG